MDTNAEHDRDAMAINLDESDLEAENAALRTAIADAEERCRLAEEQLLRVHRAVRAIKADARGAKERRNQILESAKQHASELIRQAQYEAEKIQPGFVAPDPTSLYESWAAHDPSLDDRLDEYLQNELEPDRSRDWILGERSG